MFASLAHYFSKVQDRYRSHREKDKDLSMVGAIGLIYSEIQQRRRFTTLAQRVIANYPLKVSDMRYISFSGNVVFRVETPQGIYALRMDPAATRNDLSIRSELTWLHTINRNLPIKVPQPIPASNGKLIQEIDAPDLGYSATAVLFEWIDGEPMYEAATPDRMRAIGRMIATMHDHAEEFTPPPVFDLPTWEPNMVSFWMKHKAIPMGLKHEQFDKVKQAAKWAWDEYHRVVDRLRTGIIHNDLSGRNIIVDGSDVHTIDMEACSFGPFVQDLAMTLTYYTYRSDYPALRKAVLEAYQETRPLNKFELGSLELFFTMNALRDLRDIAIWPRLTYKPWGPEVIEMSIDQIKRFEHLFKRVPLQVSMAH